MNSKVRRNSGRKSPKATPDIPAALLRKTNLDLYIKEFWDDWMDYRDGFRGHGDAQLLKSPYMDSLTDRDVKENNKKLQKLTRRRRKQQSHPRNK